MGAVGGGPATDGWDVAPRLVSGNAPVYPAGYALSGQAGTATVAFTVTEDGTTRDVEVLSATQPYFGSHAALAVRDWRFTPALKAGRPVAARVRLSFDFSPR